MRCRRPGSGVRCRAATPRRPSGVESTHARSESTTGVRIANADDDRRPQRDPNMGSAHPARAPSSRRERRTTHSRSPPQPAGRVWLGTLPSRPTARTVIVSLPRRVQPAHLQTALQRTCRCAMQGAGAARADNPPVPHGDYFLNQSLCCATISPRSLSPADFSSAGEVAPSIVKAFQNLRKT